MSVIDIGDCIGGSIPIIGYFSVDRTSNTISNILILRIIVPEGNAAKGDGVVGPLFANWIQFLFSR
jgi:hypothetical protein